MSNILHDSGGITPALIKKNLIYQSRTIEYWAHGRHESKTKPSTLWTNTNYSGTGTWAGGEDTRWVCADGPFTFPNELVGIVDIQNATDYNIVINGMVVSIGERFSNSNSNQEGSLTIIALGY